MSTNTIRIVVGSKHLEETAEKVTKLMEQAAKGDRQAEKTLLFARRYGRAPRSSS